MFIASSSRAIGFRISNTHHFVHIIIIFLLLFLYLPLYCVVHPVYTLTCKILLMRHTET